MPTKPLLIGLTGRANAGKSTVAQMLEAEFAFTQLALADPTLAPYGLAATEVLAQLGLADRLRPLLIQAENIAQAYQFVKTENAALGFVALSQVMAEGRIRSGSAWVVPARLHSPIRQDAIVLKDQPAARALMAYLRSASARQVMSAYGYLH